MAKRPPVPRRDWGNEELLTLPKLAKQTLPVERGYDTWRRWAKDGVEINSRRYYVPVVEISGVLHTSVAAVVEFLNSIDTGSLRERRSA